MKDGNTSTNDYSTNGHEHSSLPDHDEKGLTQGEEMRLAYQQAISNLTIDELKAVHKLRLDKLRQDPLAPQSPAEDAPQDAVDGNANASNVIDIRSRQPQSTQLGKPDGLYVHNAPNGVVRVWEHPEPDPRRFVIQGLVPDKAVTCLYGDGGQGKSYLALRLCFHVVLSILFAGCLVEKRRVLYIDGELDAEEFLRRASKIARGMGLIAPPEGLYYLKLPGSLTDSLVQADVTLAREYCNATFSVLDSLTMSMFGADPKEAPNVIQIIRYLETLGAVLAIDHIAKPPPGGANLSGYRQFGSVFKEFGERSVIQIIKAEGGGLQLLHKKTNFAAPSEPISLSLHFEEDRVMIEGIAADSPEMAGIEDHLPAAERVYKELLSYGETGAKVEELTKTPDMSEKTIRNHLTALKQRNRVDSKHGLWSATQVMQPEQ